MDASNRSGFRAFQSRGSIWAPVLGFTVDDINPALHIIRNIP